MKKDVICGIDNKIIMQRFQNKKIQKENCKTLYLFVCVCVCLFIFNGQYEVLFLLILYNLSFLMTTI